LLQRQASLEENFCVRQELGGTEPQNFLTCYSNPNLATLEFEGVREMKKFRQNVKGLGLARMFYLALYHPNKFRLLEKLIEQGYKKEVQAILFEV